MLHAEPESRESVIAIFIKCGDYDFTIAKKGSIASVGDRKFNHRRIRKAPVIEGCYYEETLDGSRSRPPESLRFHAASQYID